MSRHFIVQRAANVVIREIDPAAHPAHMARPDSTMTREQAWARAHQLAARAERALFPADREGREIWFVGIDGQSKKLADRPVKVKKQATKKAAAPAAAATTQGPASTKMPWE